MHGWDGKGRHLVEQQGGIPPRAGTRDRLKGERRGGVERVEANGRRAANLLVAPWRKEGAVVEVGTQLASRLPITEALCSAAIDRGIGSRPRVHRSILAASPGGRRRVIGAVTVPTGQEAHNPRCQRSEGRPHPPTLPLQ